jgi:hypothetical protein
MRTVCLIPACDKRSSAFIQGMAGRRDAYSGFQYFLLAARSLDVQPRFVLIVAGGNTMALHGLLRSGGRPDEPAFRSFGRKPA